MKGEKWLTCLPNVVISFLYSFCGILCLVTAFNPEGVRLWVLALWLLGAAILFSLAYARKMQLAAVGLGLALLLCMLGPVLASWDSLLALVTWRYDLAYGWGRWSADSGAACTGALCSLGCLTAFATARALCGKKSLLGAVILGLVPLAACLVVTDTVPNALALFGLLFTLTVLLIPHSLRRRDPKGAQRLGLISLIPALIFSLILFVSFPQEGYDKQSLGQQLIDAFQQLLSPEEQLPEPGIPLWVGGGAVELSDVGNRKESNRRVMTVTWDRGGTLYLRSCAYDTLYNNTWTNLAVPDSLNWPEQSLLVPAGTVSIRTNSILDMVLTPYYPAGDRLKGVTRGVGNYTGKRQYSYEVLMLPDEYAEAAGALNTTAYTQLPAVTNAWAAPLASQIAFQGTVQEKARAVADYVSSSARYSLNPGRMSADSTDFVRWFLEESRYGYCVHFASAATVLLRAAGIPARYVTGYLVTAKAGEETVVYGKNAHAWAEYWLPGVGWVMLEATPASALAEPERESTPTEPIHVQDTKPQTAPFQMPRLRLERIIPVALGVALMGALTQWQVRVALRRRKRRRGSQNQRALAYWRQLTEIWALTGGEPDPGLFDLAQQAKFSGRTLGDAELEPFIQALKAGEKTLKSHSFLRQLRYRFVLALY